VCYLQTKGGSLKRTFINNIEPSRLPQAFILVLFAVTLSYFYNLRAERDLLESSIRTTVQLLLVGYILQAVERFRLQGSFEKLFLKSYIALVVSSSFVCVALSDELC